MKKKIATLLATVVMVSALLAGPALARDRNDPNQGRWRGGDEWREHHPYPAYPVYPAAPVYAAPAYGYGPGVGVGIAAPGFGLQFGS